MLNYEYWSFYCKFRDYVNTFSIKTDYEKEFINKRIRWLSNYISLSSSSEFLHIEPLIELKRGDVVLVELGENLGMEFSGQHPAVVLRDCKPHVDQVFVLPLTSKRPKCYNPKINGLYLEFNRIPGMKGYQHPVNIRHKNNGKHWCNILNIRNVSKRRIYYPPTPCKMDGNDLTAISQAIKNQIAI